MDRRKYFADLITLYETSKINEAWTPEKEIRDQINMKSNDPGSGFWVWFFAGPIGILIWLCLAIHHSKNPDPLYNKYETIVKSIKDDPDGREILSEIRDAIDSKNKTKLKMLKKQFKLKVEEMHARSDFKYYRELSSLREDIIYINSLNLNLDEAAGMAGGPEVVPQEQIADTGMDVNAGMNADPNMMDPSMAGQDPMMGGGMIDPMTGMPMPAEPDPVQTLEKEKLKKLYELFEDLYTYGDVFLENIRYVNNGLLDIITFEKMNKYTEDIRNLTQKINDYLMNIFNTEKYDKNLYTYILFRTELITCIKGLRDILKLEKTDEKFEEK